jgi:hypothetical protein
VAFAKLREIGSEGCDELIVSVVFHALFRPLNKDIPLPETREGYRGMTPELHEFALVAFLGKI